jgi:hypothetical protein
MRTFKSFFLVFLFGSSMSSCDMKYENILCSEVFKPEQFHLSKAVATIISDFYTKKGPYFHVIDSVSEASQNKFKDIVTEVLRNFNITVQIEDIKKEFKKQKTKRFSVLIFTDSAESFMHFYSKLSTSDFKLRRFFTIVFIEEIMSLETKSIFDLIWKKLMTNVNIIMPRSNETIDLFTFLPFNEINKCGDTTPIKINTFDKNLMKWNNNDFHPHKTRNMQNCPLTIGCSVGSCEPSLMVRNDSNGNLEVYGIEKDIFKEFARQLNFKPTFEIHGKSPGILLANGTATGKQSYFLKFFLTTFVAGLMKKLIERRVDVGIGFISLQYLRNLFLSETKPYAAVPLAIVSFFYSRLFK